MICMVNENMYSRKPWQTLLNIDSFDHFSLKALIWSMLLRFKVFTRFIYLYGTLFNDKPPQNIQANGIEWCLKVMKYNSCQVSVTMPISQSLRHKYLIDKYKRWSETSLMIMEINILHNILVSVISLRLSQDDFSSFLYTEMIISWDQSDRITPRS